MKKRLFNPGPTNVSEPVRDSIKTHDICHREPEFFEVLSRAVSYTHLTLPTTPDV